jgi:hypothetical protein
MPKLQLKLERLGFTPEEVRLGTNIEETIFKINRKVFAGEPEVGVTLEMLTDELNKNDKMTYSEELLGETLEKCVKHYILAERGGKYYSITYYGK